MTNYDSAHFDKDKLVTELSRNVVCGSLALAGPLKPVVLKRDPFEEAITLIRKNQGADLASFAVRHDFTVGCDIDFINYAGQTRLAANEGYYLFQKGFEGGRPFEAVQARVLVPVVDCSGIKYDGIDVRMMALSGYNSRPDFYRMDFQLVGSKRTFLPHGWIRIAEGIEAIDGRAFLKTLHHIDPARPVPETTREGYLFGLLRKLS